MYSHTYQKTFHSELKGSHFANAHRTCVSVWQTPYRTTTNKKKPPHPTGYHGFLAKVNDTDAI